MDSLAPARKPLRRRTSPGAVTARPRERSGSESGASPAPSSRLPDPKRLIVVESEGAVFDSLSHRHESGYLPAFIGRFAWGADASLCASIWRSVALGSRLRGEDPQVILAAALRLLNTHFPSVRRAAVARSIEVRLSAGGPGLAAPGFGPSDPAGELVRDWISMAEGLLEEAGLPVVFPGARAFLQRLPIEFPSSDVLVWSRLPEASALNAWEMAGMGTCFGRIAGRERGDMAEYLRSALGSGYDTKPVLVIGSCRSAWLAAQAAGARFFPIVPGRESECWDELSGRALAWSPAGSVPLPRGDFSDFLECACAEPSAAFRDSSR